MTQILRLTAFTTDPHGGNPAGVVLDASSLSGDEMARIAAEVGFSETAFLVPNGTAPSNRVHVRYFSPELEVDFCGHATIASAVAWAEVHGPGQVLFETGSGPIPVEVTLDEEGLLRASLTSVPTHTQNLPAEVLDQVLSFLRWSADDLDPRLPPRVAFGGVQHLVLATASRERLAQLDYDFEGMRALMEAQNWITLQLVYRDGPHLFHSRNPFPVGGVVEDPATGAAAAALGGYLRDLHLLAPGDEFLIRQGEDMGQPSRLHVKILEDGQRIQVSGHACQMKS